MRNVNVYLIMSIDTGSKYLTYKIQSKIIQSSDQTTPGSFDDCSQIDAFVSAILCYFGQV